MKLLSDRSYDSARWVWDHRYYRVENVKIELLWKKV